MSLTQSFDSNLPDNQLSSRAEKLILTSTVVTTLIVISVVWQLFTIDINPNMPSLVNERLSWYLTRASGTVGYLLLSASTIWGIALSTKIVKELVPAPVALAMHRYLSWTAIGLSIFHAFVLLFDGYYTYTVANLLIPFTGPYKPGWVGAGIIGLYIMILNSASFGFRKRIGHKLWRKLHYTTFGAYGLATLHGWKAGSDSTELTPVYAISMLIIVFLTIFRILTAVTSKK